jgi:multidrug resistance efflux pump
VTARRYLRLLFGLALGLAVCVFDAFAAGQRSGPGRSNGASDSERTSHPHKQPIVRMHGVVEPERSHTVSTPRLSGTGPGAPVQNQLIVVRLAAAGTVVRKGDLLVEFDRANQLKTARDREAEYRDIAEQIKKRRGEHLTAQALRESQLKQARNDVAIAKLGVVGNENVGSIAAEKNVQTLQEATARLEQLITTFALRQMVEAADLRILEIQQQRAANAWQHARTNAEKMQIVAPLDGLVVLRSVFRTGTMAEIREGEEVRAGTPILDVVDTSAMRVRVNVNQADVDGLTPGRPATITLDSYPARQFKGHLQHLSPIATASMLSNRVRTFVAVFAINETDPHLLPDLAAAVEVER